MAQKTMLYAAMRYASHGFQVFPLYGVHGGACRCGDANCISPGKHPITRNGFKSATDDEDTVAGWWSDHPSANIGIATGEGSGMWVLDFDIHTDKETGEVKASGFEQIERIGDLGTALISATGGGGKHYFYAWDSMVPIRNRQNILPGVDIRGEGGYVVAPPSRHISGARYEWEVGPGTHKPEGAPSHVLAFASGARVIVKDPVQVEVAPRELDTELAEALKCIPPSLDYSSWVRVAMAIHDESRGSDEGWHLFHEWSKRGEGLQTASGNQAYRGVTDCRKAWASLTGRRRQPVSRRTLFQLAYQHGYVGPPDGDLAGPDDPRHVSDARLASMRGLWPLPEPIAPRGAEVTFPTHTGIPESIGWYRDMLTSLSDSFQVPVDLPALLSWPILMATVSGKVEVCVPGETWTEPAVLWTLVAMPSGSGKSPVHRQLIKPVREWEQALDKSSAIAKHRAAMTAAETRVKAAEKEMGSRKCLENPDQMRAAERFLEAALKQLELVRATGISSDELIVQEATSERLVEIMARQHGRALVSTSEGDIFDVILGRYSNRGASLGPWLHGYDGDTVKQERVSGDRVVERPLLNVGVATQPESLEWLSGSEVQGRGFVARLIVASLERSPNMKFMDGRGLSEAALGRWSQVLRDRLNSQLPSEPLRISLDDEAARDFRRWGQAQLDGETKAAMGGEDIRDSWRAKYAGKVLRMALMLHCLHDDWDSRLLINRETMRAAVALGNYCWAHYNGQGGVNGSDPHVSTACKIIDRCLRLKLTTFSRRDMYRGLKGPRTVIRQTSDLDEPLVMLYETGWIRPTQGAKAAIGSLKGVWTEYEVRPDLEESWT